MTLQRANTGERSHAVEIRGLYKSFGRTKALDGLDLIVAPGDVAGFLGPNGAGKSTTIRVLLGLLRADSGTVRLLGGDPWRDAVALHRRIAYVPRRCDAVAQPHRPAGHRLPGPPARQQRRHPAPRSADRALRTRPAQEGPHLLQGQPAEGGDRRGVQHQRRALHPRRADLGPGPVDGEGTFRTASRKWPIAARRCCCPATSSPRSKSSATTSRSSGPAARCDPARSTELRHLMRTTVTVRTRGDGRQLHAAALRPRLQRRRTGTTASRWTVPISTSPWTTSPTWASRNWTVAPASLEDLFLREYQG